MNNWQRIAKGDAQLKKNLEIRMATIRSIRHFFDTNGYTEAITPSLVRAGEQNLNIDQFRAVNTENPNEAYYLPTSPEYSMKKLLVAGYENIYQICKAFRAGEPPSKHHQPEFTILEWYKSNASWHELAKETEALAQHVANDIGKRFSLNREGNENIAFILRPWKIHTMPDLFRTHAKLNLDEAIARKAVLEHYIEREYGTKHAHSLSWEDCFNLIFLNEIEPKLGREQPDIVALYPKYMAALAERNDEHPEYANRFELYIKGVELGNAFQELRDPNEQRTRFECEQQLREHAKKKAYPIDNEFIEALQWGMPRCAGIAFGVDRFIMLLCGTNDIRETLWFPFDMRSSI